jgi:hypothetical protein
MEIVLIGAMGVLGYLWKSQANQIKETSHDLNDLSVRFAELHGTSTATNRTLFAHITEMKEAIARIEDHLIKGK